MENEQFGTSLTLLAPAAAKTTKSTALAMHAMGGCTRRGRRVQRVPSLGYVYSGDITSLTVNARAPLESITSLSEAWVFCHV